MTKRFEPVRTLGAITSLMRSKFSPETDAWQDFVSECQARFKTRSALSAKDRIVPDSIWEYWTAVAHAASGDYDPDGSLTTKR